MRTAILVVALGFSTAADSATLHCDFSEPWFSIDFDTATGRVTLTSPDELDPATGKPVPKVIGEAAQLLRHDAWQDYQTFSLKAGEEILMTLQLTGLADDGMSDLIFPFTGRYEHHAGGCETNSAPSYDLGKVYDEFGIKVGN
jgi:hypothetical protein